VTVGETQSDREPAMAGDGAGSGTAWTGWIDVGSGRLMGRAVGQGPPLVVLHGGPDFDDGYVGDALDPLAAGHRLITYAQRGRGRSFDPAHPPPVVDMESEVADLDGVIAWAAAERVALVGHSWGCLLALEYALRHPHRISHLVLMNAAPISGDAANRLRVSLAAAHTDAERAALPRLRDDAAYLAGDLDADAAYHRIHFGGTVRDPDLLERIVDRLRAGFTPAAIVAARRIEQGLYESTWRRPGYDLEPQLRDLRIPTLVLHGEHDLVPVELVRPIAEAIPDARLVVLPGVGHFAFLERPDAVIGEIEPFLRDGPLPREILSADRRRTPSIQGSPRE
jgi:proline iminopeptidase